MINESGLSAPFKSVVACRPPEAPALVHKGLKRLYAEANAKGVPPDPVDKLRKMFAFLDAMEEPEELRALGTWKAHTLTGDRKGTWNLSVTRNRRLTFRIVYGRARNLRPKFRGLPLT